jgi:hypothetical protein
MVICNSVGWLYEHRVSEFTTSISSYLHVSPVKIHNVDEFESMRYSKLQCICFQAYNRIRYIAVKIGI